MAYLDAIVIMARIKATKHRGLEINEAKTKFILIEKMARNIKLRDLK